MKSLEIKKYKKFMLESNHIEGEYRLNPNDLDAIEYVINNGINSLQDILNLHSLLGRYLQENWVGKLRDCEVRVGNYYPPSYRELDKLMKEYCDKLPKMSSWEAHNEFEKIHCFQDLNGRIGRLIWLSKAIKEGYNFGISFLHKYYYQTLSKYEEKK